MTDPASDNPSDHPHDPKAAPHPGGFFAFDTTRSDWRCKAISTSDPLSPPAPHSGSTIRRETADSLRTKRLEFSPVQAPQTPLRYLVASEPETAALPHAKSISEAYEDP